MPEMRKLQRRGIVSDDSRSYGGHFYVCNVCGREFEESEGENLEDDEEEPERETVLFTVSPEVSQAAIAQVASCEFCNPDGADWPFVAILDRVMLLSGVHTDYVMLEPPACPRCKSNRARLR